MWKQVATTMLRGVHTVQEQNSLMNNTFYKFKDISPQLIPSATYSSHYMNPQLVIVFPEVAKIIAYHNALMMFR